MNDSYKGVYCVLSSSVCSYVGEGIVHPRPTKYATGCLDNIIYYIQYTYPFINILWVYIL